MDLNRASELTADVRAVVEDMFTYHNWDQAQQEAGVRVRTVLAEAVLQIIRSCPPCPDRSTAIRKIREARMDANSAITHGGKY